ncbi:MAG: DUF2959 family protein [Limisphaerales bacterium]
MIVTNCARREADTTNCITSLKQAEQSMDPVLTHLHDQVLYIKHNLNAVAIASLKGETVNIQMDILKRLEDMNAAISQADSFISTLQ